MTVVAEWPSIRFQQPNTPEPGYLVAESAELDSDWQDQTPIADAITDGLSTARPPVLVVDERQREWAEQILATHEESLVKPECTFCPPIAGFPCQPVLQAEQILNALPQADRQAELSRLPMIRCPFAELPAKGGFP